MKRKNPAPVPAVSSEQCFNFSLPTASASYAHINAPTISQNTAPVIIGNNSCITGYDPAIVLRLLDTISQLQQQNSQLLDRIISQQEMIIQLRM